jgi:hypothetical protein
MVEQFIREENWGNLLHNLEVELFDGLWNWGAGKCLFKYCFLIGKNHKIKTLKKYIKITKNQIAIQ